MAFLIKLAEKKYWALMLLRSDSSLVVSTSCTAT